MGDVVIGAGGGSRAFVGVVHIGQAKSTASVTRHIVCPSDRSSDSTDVRALHGCIRQPTSLLMSAVPLRADRRDIWRGPTVEPRVAAQVRRATPR